jgi:starch phosphorylase
MRPVQTFTVQPRLPDELAGLRELALNLRWSWHHDTIELFRRLDADLWEATGHNPVLLLGRVAQKRLDEAVREEGFMAEYRRLSAELKTYRDIRGTWFGRQVHCPAGTCMAYFSAEFGITECLRIYSGGLGVLAGDHLKSASEFGLPLAGVGLLYQQGYFAQYLNADGWQQETYPTHDFYTLPIEVVANDVGQPIQVEVEFPGRVVRAQVWKAQVGRVPLYLLDTNLPDNRRDDQDITDSLYGGDLEMRIKQEIVLGIGGMRALATVGIQPVVFHMNEGHSAFAALERIRMLLAADGLSFQEARELVAATSIFTTHTPVPAGIDRFPLPMVEKYFSHYWPQLQLDRTGFMALGAERTADRTDVFNMAVLALKLAASRNAVSKLHGQVSRRMWANVWPGVPEDEVPIGSVTNGIHYLSWISRDMAGLFDRYLGPRWAEDPGDQSVWQRIERIPAEELWRTHQRRRERLVAVARAQLHEQLQRRGAGAAELDHAEEVLDPSALTIGFARRFATYKRAALILRDPERLSRILNDPNRPVQIIFAGKAHPRDDGGKNIIRQIIHLRRRPEFVDRLVFLEEYDMRLARYLVQGVDVWLNNPRRLEEASGTSGMKAVANGALNLSVLDGWWDEAYAPEVGWAIGRGEVYQDLDYQDQVESNAIYDLLEKEVVPMFYERGRDDLPRRWIGLMKRAMTALCPRFNANRMVYEYTTRFYLPAAQRYAELSADHMAEARKLADWGLNVRNEWKNVNVLKVESDGHPTVNVGDRITVTALCRLGGLTPADVCVEIYRGAINDRGDLAEAAAIRMDHAETLPDGVHRFVGTLDTLLSGRCGYTVRVRPNSDRYMGPHELGLIVWAGDR